MTAHGLLVVSRAAIATVLLVVGTAGPGWSASAGVPAPGGLVVSPSAGLDSTPLTVTSTGVCVSPKATHLLGRIFGPGFPAAGQNVVPNQPAAIYTIDRSVGGYEVPLQNTLGAFAAEQSPPAQLVGRYVLELFCQDTFGQTRYATYSVVLDFTSPSRFSASESPVRASAISALVGTPSTVKASTKAPPSTLRSVTRSTAVATVPPETGAAKGAASASPSTTTHSLTTAVAPRIHVTEAAPRATSVGVAVSASAASPSAGGDSPVPTLRSAEVTLGVPDAASPPTAHSTTHREPAVVAVLVALAAAAGVVLIRRGASRKRNTHP
jgi:hypothetical protein